MKSLIFIISFLFFAINAMALTCPTAEQIRQGDIQPFVALSIDDDSPVDKDTFQRFQNSVDHFYHAEWLSSVEYPSQCYYQLKQPPYYSVVSLGARQNIIPNGNYWYFDQSQTRKMCSSENVRDCAF